MGEWREVALGDVLTLQRGFDLPSRDRIDGPVPVISSSGVTGRHAVAKVDPPGVVIGRYGSLGSVHWVTEPFWPLNTSLWVKDFKGNDPRYVGYLLETIEFDGGSAAAVPGVNRNHLHALRVRVPAVPSQRKIAMTVAVIDELVAIYKRRVRLLDRVATSLYREWFVRFRFPDGPSGLRDDSELGSVPEGWRVATIAELAARERNAVSSGPFGSKLGRKDYVDAGVPVIRGRNLAVGGGFKDEGFVFVSNEKADTLRSSIARAGDVIVTQRGTLGQVGLVPRNARYSRYVISQSQMKITVDPAFSTYYLYSVLRSPEAVTRIRNMAISAGVPHINLALLREMKVVVPPVSIQTGFGGRAAPIYQNIEHCGEALRQLAATRELLLPRLVSGRLDVSDVALGDLLDDAEVA